MDEVYVPSVPAVGVVFFFVRFVPPSLAKKRVDEATRRSGRSSIFCLHGRELAVSAGDNLHRVTARSVRGHLNTMI